MRLFIAGGAGFIGKHVVALALQRCHDLRCLVRDPRKAESLAPGGITPINGGMGRNTLMGEPGAASSYRAGSLPRCNSATA